MYAQKFVLVMLLNIICAVSVQVEATAQNTSVTSSQQQLYNNSADVQIHIWHKPHHNIHKYVNNTQLL